MGFIEDFAQSNGLEVKGSQVWSRIVDDWTADSGAPVPDAFASHETAADRIGWVLACTRRKAQDVASCPFKIYQKPTTAKGKRVDITDQPPFAVWRDPNPWETRNEFWQKCSMYLDLFGENFWELVGTPENLQEVYAWEPRMMKPLAHKRDFVAGFEMDPGGGGDPIRFGPDEMLWLRHPNPFDQYRGLSRLHALGQGLNMHDFALRYAVNTFKNNVRPSVIAKSPTPMEKNSRERFYTRFRDAHAGPNANMDVLLLDGDDIEIEIVKHSMQDLEFSDLLKWTRQEILTAFGVPPAVVGIFEGSESVRANTAEQLEWYWDTTVIPLQRQIAMAVTEYLLMPLNDKYEAEFDVSEVKTLQENESEKGAETRADVERGLRTINEGRERLGLEPVNSGAADTLYIPMNWVAIASTDKATQAALEAEGEADRNTPEQPEGGAVGAGEDAEPDEGGEALELGD